MVELPSVNRSAIAEVIWKDNFVETSDDAMKEAVQINCWKLPVLRSTAGYVISKENNGCLVLATDLYSEDQAMNEPVVIPWEAIVDWWEFEVH